MTATSLRFRCRLCTGASDGSIAAGSQLGPGTSQWLPRGCRVRPGGSQPNAADRYDNEQGVRESRVAGVSKQGTSSDESIITSRFVSWAQLAQEFGSIRDAGDAGRGGPVSPRMRRRWTPGRDTTDDQQVARPGKPRNRPLSPRGSQARAQNVPKSRLQPSPRRPPASLRVAAETRCLAPAFPANNDATAARTNTRSLRMSLPTHDAERLPRI